MIYELIGYPEAGRTTALHQLVSRGDDFLSKSPRALTKPAGLVATRGVHGRLTVAIRCPVVTILLHVALVSAG